MIGRRFSSIGVSLACGRNAKCWRFKEQRETRRREKQNQAIVEKHTARTPEEVKAAQARAAVPERPAATPKAAATEENRPAPMPLRPAPADPGPADRTRVTPAIARSADIAKRTDKAVPAAVGPDFESRTPIEKKRDCLLYT